MSCLFYLNGLWDRRQVTVPLIFFVMIQLLLVRQHATFLWSSHLVFFSMRFVSIHLCGMNTASALKKFRFILSDRSDFHLIVNLSKAFHSFARRVLTSLSVDEMLLLRYGNYSTNFTSLALRMKTALFLAETHCFISIHIEDNVSYCLF